MNVKWWVLGVGVTMGAKRLGFGVGRAWGNPEEGRKTQSIAENDYGYAITCLINLLTTSDRVLLKKLMVPPRVKNFHFLWKLTFR
jgi:hypothetical protein